jgi:hypothetical protein
MLLDTRNKNIYFRGRELNSFQDIKTFSLLYYENFYVNLSSLVLEKVFYIYVPSTAYSGYTEIQGTNLFLSI